MPQVVESEAAGLRESGGDKLACLNALERKVLWLSTWMIHNANHLRPEPRRAQGRRPPGVERLGRDADDGALFPRAAAGGPGRGEAARSAGVSRDPISARPPDPRQAGTVSRAGRRAILSLAHQGRRHVDFSTGSVGLGVGITLFASIVQDYVRLKELVPTDEPPGRMIALMGDAELDEGNVFEALLEGWKHDVRNLWWIIDYNRQSLDGVVTDRLFAASTRCSRRWAGTW